MEKESRNRIVSTRLVYVGQNHVVAKKSDSTYLEVAVEGE